jgi:hypothetical protein
MMEGYIRIETSLAMKYSLKLTIKHGWERQFENSDKADFG